jgi:hypothetical protein
MFGSLSLLTLIALLAQLREAAYVLGSQTPVLTFAGLPRTQRFSPHLAVRNLSKSPYMLLSGTEEASLLPLLICAGAVFGPIQHPDPNSPR